MYSGLTRVTNMDPPRVSMSAYAFFVQKNLDDSKKLHLGDEVNFDEFSKMCSDKWKAMSESEKKNYFDLAKEEANFHNDLITTDPIPPPENDIDDEEQGSSRQAEKKSPRKSLHAPKRNLSAFFWFSNEIREEVKRALFADEFKEYTRRWKALSDSERAKFEDIAAKDKERYEKELAIYNREKEGDTSQEKANH